MKPKSLQLITLVLSILFSVCNNIFACSVWSAVGEKAMDGITLTAKNLDYDVGDHVELHISKQEGQFAFLGEYVYSNNNSNNTLYLGGGVNEKGLVVTHTEAVTVPKEARSIGDSGCLKYILTHFSRVDEAIADQELYEKYSPQNIMISDSASTAIIEIAPDQNVNIQVTDNGVMYHTNSYTSSDLTQFNTRNNAATMNSDARLAYLKEQMEISGKIFTFQDFIRISEYKHMSEDIQVGPDGIWRQLSKDFNVQTLSSFIVQIPDQDSDNPEIKLMVRIVTPSANEQVVRLGEFEINGQFWSDYHDGDLIPLPK